MDRLEAMLARILADASESEKEILAHAEEQAAQIRAEGEARCAKILADAEELGSKEAAIILERAQAECEALRRREKVRVKSTAVDSVYEAALESLIALSPEKKEAFLLALLEARIADCLQSEKDSAEYIENGEIAVFDTWEVLLCEEDREAYGERLIAACAPMAAAGGKKLVLSPLTPAIPGGLILRTGDIEYNLSLVPLLGQVRAQTEAQVYGMLFRGEDA